MNNYPEDIFFLKTLLELDTESAMLIKNNPQAVPVLSPGILVTIPDSLPERFNCLALTTTIRIFRQHQLDFNESGLTIPHILMMPGSLKKFPVHLLFRYHISDEPGFRITEVQTT
jgi:hypothetical protein